MAWEASPTTILNAETMDGDEYTDTAASSTVTLNPGEGCAVECEYDPPGTPTDDCVVGIFRSIDGSSFEDVPGIEFTIPNTPDPCMRAVFVTGCYAFYVRGKMDGSTDTTGTLTVKARKDGISV